MSEVIVVASEIAVVICSLAVIMMCFLIGRLRKRVFILERIVIGYMQLTQPTFKEPEAHMIQDLLDGYFRELGGT